MRKRLFAGWMSGPGKEGPFTDISRVPKGPASSKVVKATRDALVNAIRRDLLENPLQVRTSHYSRVSGYSGRVIRLVAHVQRKELNLNNRGRPGGARFRLPPEVVSLAQKAVRSARSMGGRDTVFIAGILRKYAGFSGHILLPTAIGHVVRRLDPKVKISYSGCSAVLEALRSNRANQEYRTHKKNVPG